MKDQITEISLAGFLKNGIRKMTVQRLVAPLGISTKTVYKYFQDKEALLKECLTLHYTRLINALQESMEASPNAVHAILICWNLTMEADFGVNRSFYHDLNYYFPSLQDVVLKKYGNKISSLIAKKIENGIQQGYFIKDLNPLLSLEAMSVLYGSITRTDRYKKFKLKEETLVEHTVFIYLRGICSEKGLKEFATYKKI